MSDVHLTSDEQCMWGKCQAPATKSVHLRFWAKGHSRDTHPPVVSEPVVYVCDEHRAEASASEWYGPEQRRQILGGMQSIGKADPDFETADVVLKPLAWAIQVGLLEGDPILYVEDGRSTMRADQAMRFDSRAAAEQKAEGMQGPIHVISLTALEIEQRWEGEL